MTERCPLVSEIYIPVGEYGFTENTDIPRACLECIHKAMYGPKVGPEMMKRHEEGSIVTSRIGVREVDAAERMRESTARDRVTYRDHGSARDTTRFTCEVEYRVKSL